MRTLMTQMRLRRLLRLYAAETERLRERPFRRPERETAARQLLDQARNVRQGWLAERTAAAPVIAGTSGPVHRAPAGTVDRQVVRRLVALEAAIAKLTQPGLDLDRARAEFEDQAIPLLLMLRGLDGYDEAGLLTSEPAPLARTA